MGMFDWYEPRPALHCPRCNARLGGWQGKSGPRGLFEWTQGIRTPTGQRVDDDCALARSEREKFGLPEDFELYTECEGCNLWVEAQGLCEAGTWTQTAFVDPLEPPGLPVGWKTLQEKDRQLLVAELHREIGPGHALENVRLLPLARLDGGDDVLIRVFGPVSPLWVVHLAWANASDPRWPRARAFTDLTSFVAAEQVAD